MNIEQHIAGDTLDFNVSVADYPASDGWTLKYRLTPRFATPSQAPIDITAATNADGETYDVQVAPTTTAAWAAGAYTWARWVEKTGARQTLDESGQLEVKADPSATAQGFDARSHARKTLEAIQAVIERRATLDQESYSIGGRSLSRTPHEALIVLRDKYAMLVQSEDTAARLAKGLPGRNRIMVRM